MTWDTDDEVFEGDEDVSFEDDWADFKKSVRTIHPQNKSKHHQSIPKAKTVKIASRAEQDFEDYGVNIQFNHKIHNTSVEIDNFDGVDKNLYRDVIAGKVAPENRLDLHNRTLAEAQIIIPQFITQSYLQGHRLVLIITGKGDATDSHKTLRGNLPKFLNSQNIKSMILFAATAALKHGGSGAYYVFLRKNRG